MTSRSIISRRIGVALVVVLLVAGPTLGSGLATAQEDPREAFVVDVESSGDATATLVLTYDLASENEQVAFEQLRANVTRHAPQYGDQLSRIAERTSAQTGREMQVIDASGSIETVDDIGVVRLSVRWEGLAAVEDDRLVVDEPFASGFQPDRPLVVIAPDGYVVTETAIPPAENGGETARWNADSDLSGFETTLAPSDDGETGVTTPTPLVSMLALLTIAGLGYAARRRLG